MATPIQKKLDGSVLSKVCDAIPVIKRTARGRKPKILVLPLPSLTTALLISRNTEVYIHAITPAPTTPYNAKISMNILCA